MVEVKSQLLSLRKRINRIRKKFHDTITNFRFVKTSILSLIPGYLGLLILAVIIAFVFGGNTAGPGEYFIWTNTISDLGGADFTIAPYIYDIAAIVCGILTVPFWFYLEKMFVPMPKKPEEFNKITRLRYRMGSYALLFSLLGSIGYIGVGIFSIDRNYFDLMHYIFAVLTFGGFIIGAIFYSLLGLLYEQKNPKIIELYGIFGPISFLGLTIGLILVDLNFWPICEWLLLISIVIWILGQALIIIFKKKLQI